MHEIVIDTHILIWMLTEPSKLSMDAIFALKEAENSNSKIYVAATAFSLGLGLISADHKIQALSSIKVIW